MHKAHRAGSSSAAKVQRVLPSRRVEARAIRTVHSNMTVPRFSLALVLSCCSISIAWSQAASYPVKVVRIIKPVAPGGNQDTIARAIAEQLTRAFGQQVIVESRPGASAIV